MNAILLEHKKKYALERQIRQYTFHPKICYYENDNPLRSNSSLNEGEKNYTKFHKFKLKRNQNNNDSMPRSKENEKRNSKSDLSHCLRSKDTNYKKFSQLRNDHDLDTKFRQVSPNKKKNKILKDKLQTVY